MLNNIQIESKSGLAILTGNDSGRSYEINASSLLDFGIVYYEKDGTTEWVEREPFQGKESVPTEARATIDSLISVVETKRQEELDAEAANQNAIPQVVSRRQGRQQLLLVGLLSQVQPIIDGIVNDTERQMMQIFWDDAQEFERDSQELISIATALGLTSAQLDDMFVNASKL